MKTPPEGKEFFISADFLAIIEKRRKTPAFMHGDIRRLSHKYGIIQVCE
jgi:hypothetical protein